MPKTDDERVVEIFEWMMSGPTLHPTKLTFIGDQEAMERALRDVMVILPEEADDGIS